MNQHLMFLLFAVGCTSSGDTGALPDWSEGYESTGNTSVGEFTEYALRAATDVGWETRLHGATSADPCAVTPTGTVEGYQALDCTLESNELDLYGSGLAFDLEIPAGICDYLIFGYYMYEAWEVGTGPSEVSWEVDTDGNIINESNAMHGVPYCPYDYSDDPGKPNCCLGSYTLTITFQSTAQVQVSEAPWGGRASDCYGGAAFISPEASFNEDGWPMDTIEYIGRAAYLRRHAWNPLSTTFHSNVPLASWYDPVDHDGTLPAGLTGDWARPLYYFGCYDNAAETMAMLTLNVREWNEVVEFEADADPDTTGAEPVSGDPINDLADWADATPGDATWIHDTE